jgi:hypothetical protein
LAKEQVVTNVGEQSVDFKALGLKGKNQCFSIKETAEKINPEKSYPKIKSGKRHSLLRMYVLLCISCPSARVAHFVTSSLHSLADSVVLFLSKAKEGQRWDHLRASERQTTQTKAKPPKADDVDASDPSASLMNLMKQMYDDGDDEMKRTIAKAWTESRNKTPGDEFASMDV